MNFWDQLLSYPGEQSDDMTVGQLGMEDNLGSYCGAAAGPGGGMGEGRTGQDLLFQQYKLNIPE